MEPARHTSATPCPSLTPDHRAIHPPFFFLMPLNQALPTLAICSLLISLSHPCPCYFAVYISLHTSFALLLSVTHTLSLSFLFSQAQSLFRFKDPQSLVVSSVCHFCFLLSLSLQLTLLNSFLCAPTPPHSNTDTLSHMPGLPLFDT